MPKRFLMGLDIGGGSGRALVVDLDSGAVATATRPWRFPAADSAIPMGFDADLDTLWQQLGAASHEALERAGAAAPEVIGVAVTSMRFGLVVADAQGNPLYAGPNRDARAIAEALKLAADHGDALNTDTGHFPMSVMAAPRLQWLARNAPETWEQSAVAYSLNDAITHRLCGAIATDASQAGETLLCELERRHWAWEWIDRLELPHRLFPRIAPAGECLGELTADAAAHFGLAAGTPVAQGGADTQSGLLGVGALENGSAAVIAGTTAPVEIVLDRPAEDPAARCWQGHHLVDGRWVIESSAGPVGEVLEWLAGALHPDLPQPVAALLAEADQSIPGASGILSTLGAQIMDARAPSLPSGSISLSHLLARDDPARRRHLARAVVEGLAYGIRGNLQQAREISEREVTALALGGGLSRSASFAQLLADVCGLPVETRTASESSALGAAICAGVAAEVFGDLAQGSQQLSGEAHRFEPDAERTAVYEELHTHWRLQLDGEAPGRERAMSRLAGAALSPASAETTSVSATRPRILVTATVDETSLDALRELGDVEYASYRDAGRLLKDDSLVEALAGFEVFVTEIDLVSAAAVSQLPDLRVVASCRGNAVNVDVEACSLLGIPVLNAPGRNADAVADLAVVMMGMLARKLRASSGLLESTPHDPGDMRILATAFGPLRGRELWNKTVGLVGMGAVGRGVARRARAFGARVIAFDPYLDPERVALDGVESVDLNSLLRSSDFVSLHAPVTDETTGMIGAAELALLKPDAYLINTARPALLDEAALVEALDGERLAGAALDVFDAEPPGSDHPLLNRDNVIATPHVGGNTAEVAAHQGQIIAEDLGRLLRGEMPRHALDPKIAEAFDGSRPRPQPDAAIRERLAELATGPGPSTSDLNQKRRS
ncbi:hypothetical protein MK489_05235 [Myxococcota bacterium]|nr:hypothetical protein [Myxococcota bacterium]